MMPFLSNHTIIDFHIIIKKPFKIYIRLYIYIKLLCRSFLGEVMMRYVNRL